MAAQPLPKDEPGLTHCLCMARHALNSFSHSFPQHPWWGLVFIFFFPSCSSEHHKSTIKSLFFFQPLHYQDWRFKQAAASAPAPSPPLKQADPDTRRLLLFQPPSCTGLCPQSCPSPPLSRPICWDALVSCITGVGQGEQRGRWSQLFPRQTHHVPLSSAKPNFPGRISRPDSCPVPLF